MPEAYDAARAVQPADRGRRLGGWLLAVLLWPVVLLGPFLSGTRTFLPYDLAQFPPAAVQWSPETTAALRAESNFDVTETPVWFGPELALARRILLEDGALPAWNPAARTGTALLAHGHDGLWHPTTWLALCCREPASGLALVAFANFAIAALLAFGLLRRLGLLPAAAAFGALAFAASSTLAANAHSHPRLASLIWLPGMLWALHGIAEPGRGRAGPTAGFALCFSLTWCAGFPPYAVPATLVAGFTAAWLLFGHWRTRGRERVLRLGLWFLLAFALGAALAAPYLWPAFSFFGDSARSLQPDLARLSHSAFETYGLLGYLVPDLFGRPDLAGVLPYERSPLPLLLGNRRELGGMPLLPNFNATEYAVFPGTLVLWLALAGALRRGASRLPLVALLLLFSMAAFLPGFRDLFLLPGIRVAPPLRYLGPAALLLAWLAASGLDAALRQEARRTLWLPAGLALATAAVALALAQQLTDPAVFEHWRLADHVAARFRHLAADPTAVTADWVRQNFLREGGTDFVQHGRSLARAALARQAPLHLLAALLLPAIPFCAGRGGRLATALAALLLLATGAELWRTAQTFDRGIEGRHPVWTPVHDFLVKEHAAAARTGGFMIARASRQEPLPPPLPLPAGTLQPYGIRDLQVYTFYDARSSAPLERLLGPAATAKGYVASCLPDGALLRHPLLDLLGVRFVLATEPLQTAGPRVGPELRGPGGEFYVYERPGALPRAFVVDQLIALDDDEAVLQAITAPDFQPRRIAYAARPSLSPAAELTPPRPGEHPSERNVVFTVDRAGAVELEVGPGAAGWLVLADTYLLGWQAVVDGVPATIERCNHALRAVRVPGGSCRVRFSYRVPGLAAGLWLWAIATLALAALAWCHRSSRREHAADTAM